MVHHPDARWHTKHRHLDQAVLAVFVAAAGACTLAYTGEPSQLQPFYGNPELAPVAMVRLGAVAVDFALCGLLLAGFRGIRSRSPLPPIALGALIVLAALAPAVEAIVAVPELTDSNLYERGLFELANFGPAGSCIIVLLAAWRPLHTRHRRPKPSS